MSPAAKPRATKKSVIATVRVTPVEKAVLERGWGSMAAGLRAALDQMLAQSGAKEAVESLYRQQT